ncbi:hypothetical protein IIA16_06305, partial [bacterium]|nr:hypothetical protein [bacterium]
VAVVLGAAGLALWALNLPRPVEATQPQRQRPRPLGARIKGATCSSSLWDTAGRLPEDAWSACWQAVDGEVLGLGAWVSDSRVGEEWIEVELAYSYPVWGVRLHFSDWPCLRTPAGERVCGEGTRPGMVRVDGRLAGEGWSVLATVEEVPSTPWVPMDITFPETRILHLRILAEPGSTGRRHFLQLAEVVINPPAVEEYPGPVPSPE